MNAQLFAPDPIDFLDPSPYAALEFYGHLVVGAIWFFAGIIAFAATKGKALHIRAGQACIISTFLIAITAAVMFTVDFIPPLALNGVTACYAVATAWLALKPESAKVRRAEYALTAIEIMAFGLFLSIALPNVLGGGIPIIGPGIVAIVPIVLLAGDLNWHLRPSQRGRMRVQRHLARMVWAFVIVLRAPLVEFETAGFYDLPDPLLVVGPVLLGLAMLAYFQLRYGKGRPKKPEPQPA